MGAIKNIKIFNRKSLVSDYWTKVITPICIEVFGKDLEYKTKYYYIHLPLKWMFLLNDFKCKMFQKAGHEINAGYKFYYTSKIEDLTNIDLYNYIVNCIKWANKNLGTKIEILKYKDEKK